MKLAILSQGFPPDKYSGGVGRYYSELINELKKKTEEIHVFTSIERKNEENVFFHLVKNERKFVPLINNYFNSVNYSKKVFKELNRFKKKIDFVEAPLAMLNSYYYSENKFAPLISSVQTPLSEIVGKKNLFSDKKLIYALEKKILKNSDKIVTASNYSKEFIVNKYFKIKNENIITINQGINTDKFKPIKSIKLINEPNLILFIGRIEPRKGLKVLIQAIPLIKQKTKIIVISENLDQNTPYHKEIMELIKKNSIKNIDFLGFLPEENLIEVYNKADLIVEPSFSESACYVLIEAMACSKPVIASNIGGMKEISLKELQFQSGNYIELAEKINFLLENKKTLNKLGKKSREKIVKEHNIKKSAKDYIKLYSSLKN